MLILAAIPNCHLVGVDPAPETLWNAKLELHSVLVTRLAHWRQKGVNWCEAEVREQNCDY